MKIRRKSRIRAAGNYMFSCMEETNKQFGDYSDKKLVKFIKLCQEGNEDEMRKQLRKLHPELVSTLKYILSVFGVSSI